MRYSDLIHFEPIESVVELRRADVEDEARRLVKTFVLSDRMGEQLTDLVFPNLQFDSPGDNKALLVVGNYGTGKSHLMAVLSAIAERADVTSLLTNKTVAEKSAIIAGRFRVIRTEINTTMSLRDFVCGVLEESLGRLGVDYQFLPAAQTRNPKEPLAEMMAAFHEAHPNHGLLLVLDELLDYLRGRKEQELIVDLNFLRALGEFCKGSRFRFVAGVQESLFDSSSFQFVADSLRRVKDRFEQVRIAREDVAYVVSERLLLKDAKQAAQIREHLQKFAPLYSSMNERMDDFVRLFPVHPAYLEVFERVYVAEKREILKTISGAIRKLLEQDVPKEEPGLIAYDSYWKVLKDNPSFKAIPDVRKVIEKSDVLEARIQQAFTRPAYKAVALRIINGLSVHRLTTGDIYAKMGATAEELRDDLSLILPVMPEKDAEFLRTMVETILKEILRTVSGQFLNFNKENGQYYLDLEKDIDFDSLIEKKAEGLANDRLDHYYFQVLARVLECADETVRTGFRIWEHELEWRERKAGRSGYLFFGAPNERPNTVPSRDFYLYFMEPYEPTYFKDEKKGDEVFFRLKEREPGFEEPLKLYAGAREQAAAASGGNKKVYEDKASEHLRALTSWLLQNLGTHVQVTHQGRTKPLIEIVKGKVTGDAAHSSVRDLVNLAGSVCLAQDFQEQSPDYPTFGVRVTSENRKQAAQDALRWIGGGVKSKQGTAILDALELLDGEVLKPRNSRYAKAVLELLGKKPKGQVVNHSELVQDDGGLDYWSQFRIEPEFLVVVLAALVYSGDLVLSIAGKKLDASSLEQLVKLGIEELLDFKHLERPRGLPLAELQELFDVLGLPPGMIVNPVKREEALEKLGVTVAHHVERAVVAQQQLQSGLSFWGKPILIEKERDDWGSKLGSLKTFLESLQPFNSEGKLKNFPHEVATIQAQKVGLELVGAVAGLVEVLQQVGTVVAYLGTAEAVLPADHPWVEEVRAVQTELLPKLTNAKLRSDPSFHRDLVQRLAGLKTKYQEAYLALHQRARLGVSTDKKKAALSKDPRLVQLQKLSGVEMMPAQQLTELQNTLLGLKTCFSLSKPELDAKPLCSECSFRPVEEPAATRDGAATLASVDERLDELVTGWTKTLIANLEDPTVSVNVELVTDQKGKKALSEFLRKKVLPDPIDPTFLKALQEVLSGLQKVIVKTTDLQQSLLRGGIPCTMAELRQRFEAYVTDLGRGKDGTKVRVVIE